MEHVISLIFTFVLNYVKYNFENNLIYVFLDFACTNKMDEISVNVANICKFFRYLKNQIFVFSTKANHKIIYPLNTKKS